MRMKTFVPTMVIYLLVFGMTILGFPFSPPISAQEPGTNPAKNVAQADEASWELEKVNAIKFFPNGKVPDTKDGVSFSSDLSRVAVSYFSEHRVKVFDVASGQMLFEIADPNVDFHAHRISLSGNGEVLVGQDKKRFTIWAISSKKELGTIDSNDWRYKECFPSPDETILAVCSHYKMGRIQIYELKPRLKMLAEFPGSLPVKFTPDSKQLIYAADGNSTLVIWDVEKRSELGRVSAIAKPKPDRGTIRTFLPSPDGTQVVIIHNPIIGKTPPKLVCWEIAAKKELWSIDIPDTQASFAVSPKNDYLAIHSVQTVHSVDSVSIWATNPLKKVRTIRVDRTWNSRFSPDGKCLVFFGAGIESEKLSKTVMCVWAFESAQIAVLPLGTPNSANLPGWMVDNNPRFSSSGDRLTATDALQLYVWRKRSDSKGLATFQSDANAEKVVRLAGKSDPIQPVGKLELTPAARKAVGRVKTTSDDNIDQAFTQHLQNLSASVTKEQIVLEFDVDRKKWQPVTRSFSLVVRIFDKDEKNLTHFITSESFTASPDVYDGWMKVVNRLKDAPPNVQAEMLAGFTPKLLEAKGNRLIYNVNPAYLQNAAIVEVGLIHVKKKGPF